VVGDGQPDAREGQAGRLGVAERLVVPMKPGNAGGGKGPQFKTDAISGEGREIGQPCMGFVSSSEFGSIFFVSVFYSAGDG
jgi:hypothetical protein